ncbi:hypothetical protein AX769_09750 [Frondihabitans sp. PAMC 28766]|uniref:hypothetical protein n=1 Tax=Frondihabitans sp. PAMC 28766 TaxID=1795630 RepID=UPI00078DF355|nr:hypothetical protein [Frondihabitans sp. PAMC 28766]AMM20381.1 hypothetical protein AX769_09750 [Frondihabitans sp. PAMC 28766]
MTVWTDFVKWLSSSEGSRILTDAILPFIAIVVAGAVAALIARSMGKRLLDSHEREATSAAVTSLIASARKATTWSTLGHDEKQFAQHLGDEAAVRLRLLAIPGAGLAATWAEHEIVAIKVNSATFTFQAEQTFIDVRDRLIEWQAKPSRAKKLFRYDLERWRVEDDAVAGASGAGAPAPVGPSAAAPAVVEAGVAASAPFADAATATPVAGVTPSAEAPVVAAPSEALVPAGVVPAGVVPAGVVPAGVVPADLARANVIAADRPMGSAPESASSPPASKPPVASAPATTAAVADSSTTGVDGAGAEPIAGASTAAGAAPVRTSVVSAPVVQPPRALVPSSPSDLEAGPTGTATQADADGGEREPAFSAPVSAGQVRRRTSPDRD